MVFRSVSVVAASVLFLASASAWGQAVPATLRLERVDATSRSNSVGTASHKVEQAGNSFTVSLTYSETRGTGTMSLKVDLPNASFTDSQAVTGGLQLTPNPTFQITGSVNGTGVAGGGEYEVRGTAVLGNQPICTAQVPPDATRACQLGVLGLQSNLARITITLNVGFATLTATAHYSYRPPENMISFGTRPARAVNPGQPAVDPLPGGIFYGRQDVSAIVAYRLATQQNALTALELSTDVAGEEPLARSAPHPVSSGRDSAEIQYEAITLLTSGYTRETPEAGLVYLKAVLFDAEGNRLAESAPNQYILAPGPKLEYRVEGPSTRPLARCRTFLGSSLPAPIVLHASYSVFSDESERARFTLAATGLGLDGRARLLYSEVIRDDVPPGTEVTYDFRKLQIPLRDVSRIAIVLYAELASGSTLISEAYPLEVECVAVTGYVPLRARRGEIVKIPIGWSIYDNFPGVRRSFGTEDIVEFTGSRPLGSAVDEVSLPALVLGQTLYLLDYYLPETQVSAQVRIAVDEPVEVSPPAVHLIPKAKLDIGKADNPQTVLARVEPSALIDAVGLGEITGAGATSSTTAKVRFASATLAQLPPFVGVKRTWVFEPGVPRDGSFSANLTLSYDPEVLPDHPNFDESKLEMVAYDPASGDFERLASTLDRTARSVTARVDRLARYYSLVVFGPFTRSLLAAPALPAGGGFQTGLSVVNPDTAATTLEVRAFRPEPIDLPVPLAAGQQVSGVLSQLIPALADTPGAWVLARGGANTVAAQLLNAGTAFDTIPMHNATSAFAVFPNVRRQPNAVSTLFLANPDTEEVRVDLTVFGLDGGVAANQSYTLQPSQNLQLPLDRAFPDLPAEFAGYAVLKASRGVFATHVLLGRGAMAGSNALPVPVAQARGPVRLFAPHLGDESATLALVNMGNTEARVTVRGYVEAGAVFSGAPVELLLAPGQGWQSTLHTAFRTGTLPRGSILVESASDLVLGELSIGDPVLGRLASLPLVSTGAQSVVIPYFANDGAFQTSLLISGTGAAVNATVTAHRANGSTIGTGNVSVAANGVSNALLSSVISGTAGMRGGYLRVSANQPLLAYADVSSTVADHAIIVGQAAAGGSGGGSGGANVSVTVSNLDLGSVPVSTSGQPGTVQIRNSGSASVTVTVSASGPFSATPASLTIPAGGTGAVTVTFRPVASTPARQEGVLTIAVSGATVATVALAGTVTVPAPVINLSPGAPFNLGSVNVGSTGTLAVTLANSGGAALTINSITRVSQAFSPTESLPLTVPAGGTARLTIRFAPTSAGAISDTWTLVTSPASIVPPFVVSGTGVAGSTGATATLAIDGGVYGVAAGFPSGGATGYFVNRLTPPSYPATLRSVLVFFPRGELPIGAAVSVLSASNPSGIGGLTLTGLAFQRTAATIGAQDVFSEIAVPPLTITSGDFVVGFSAANPAGIYPVVVDTASGTKARSYLSSDGATFRLADASNVGDGNFGIRARDDLAGGGTGAAALRASVASLALDATAVTATSPAKTLTVSNTGTAGAAATLTVTGPFTVSPASVSLAAGASATVSVAFRPTAATPVAQTGTLTVSAPGVPSVIVALSGTVATSGGETGNCVSAPANVVSWFGGDGNGNDQTGANAGTPQGGVSYSPGRVGQAFNFNGTSSYMQLGDPANLRLTTGISIEAWINPRSVRAQVAGPAMGAIVTKWAQVDTDTPSSDSYGLWIINSGGSLSLFSAIHQTGPREPNIQGGTIPLNAWTHVAMTFDGASGAYRLYVNGAQVASMTSVGNLYPTNRSVNIGREDSYIQRLFDGLIDEPTIYNRALPAAEIQAIVAAGAAGKCKGGTTTPPPPPGGYSVTVTPTTVAVGGAVTVSWTDPGPTFTRNWVGLFPAGVTPTSSNLVRPAWQYTERASGTTSMTIPGTPPGRYIIHYFTSDGYAPVMASSSVITVTP